MSEVIGNDVLAFYQYAAKSPYTSRFLKRFLGKSGDVSAYSNSFNPVYGAAVFDQINREANAHGILKKIPWEKSGFRYTKDNPSGKGSGGADGGAVGTVVDHTPANVDTKPAFLHTPFDLTMEAGFRISHDDGLDAWEWKKQINRDTHAQLFNEELLRSAEAESADIDSSAEADAKSSALNSSGNNGKGLESLDRAVASKVEEDDLAATGAGHYDLYEGDWDRDTSTDFDSYVVRPDGSQTTYGTNLPFQMAGVDAIIDGTEDDGAEEASQIFLTRRDTRRALYDELGSVGRFDLTDVQAAITYDGLSTSATHAGRDISFTVSAYQGRPIVADKNVPSNGTTDTSFPNGGTGLGHMFLLDQRFMDIQVGLPTYLVELDDPLALNSFTSKALYLTVEQLYSRRPGVHGKLRSVAS